MPPNSLDHWSDRVSMFADGELEEPQADEVRAHLAHCEACQGDLCNHVTLVAQMSTLHPGRLLRAWRSVRRGARRVTRKIGRKVRGWWQSLWWWWPLT